VKQNLKRDADQGEKGGFLKKAKDLKVTKPKLLFLLDPLFSL
jgi:hypothetical protein